MLKEICHKKAFLIALKLKKEINSFKGNIKNKQSRLNMINFFIFEFCTEEERNDYIFITSNEEKCLMCIAKKPPTVSKIPNDYCYIECVVNGLNSKVTFKDFFNKAKTFNCKKVALGAASLALVKFYKSYGFTFVSEFEEDWSSIGHIKPHKCFSMKY